MRHRNHRLALVLLGGLIAVWGGLAWMLIERDTPVASVEARATGYRIPVNTATRGQLRALPGIGRVNSGYLIMHRNTHGPFEDASGLMAVRMIGVKTAAAVEPWVRFD